MEAWTWSEVINCASVTSRLAGPRTGIRSLTCRSTCLQLHASRPIAQSRAAVLLTLASAVFHLVYQWSGEMQQWVCSLATFHGCCNPNDESALSGESRASGIVVLHSMV